MRWPQLSILLFLNNAFIGRSVASPVPAANGTQDLNFPEIPSSKNLVWHPCYGGYFCAMLDVPLDYLNPQLGRASVPIIKKPSLSSCYKGILFLNPGGPGGSGVQLLLNASDEIKNAVGPDYDLAAWEPRGIGYSVPAVVPCYLLDSNATISGLSKHKHKRSRSLKDYIIHGPGVPLESLGDANTYANEGASCAEYNGKPLDAGPHMTTATVARDLVSILDAYAMTPEGRKAERDPKALNYWGYSYGTMIGQAFASMFPKRVGRVVVDGVLDPDAWVAGTLDAISTIDQDKIFATFFFYCHSAGPTLCPFSANATALDIFNRFEIMISHLNSTHATQQNWENATALDTAILMIQTGLRQAMYDPIGLFPTIGTGLVTVENIILSGNVRYDSILDILRALGLFPETIPELPPGDPSPELIFERFHSVACADVGGKLYNSSFEEYAMRLLELQGQSWIGGNGIWLQYLPCLSWPIVSDDVYDGPFGGKTKGKILAVGNRFDPVTPLVNAKKTARIFPDAELLTIEGTGHTSLAAHNNCAFAKINTFFNSDKKSGKETSCPLEAGPWNISLQGPLEKLGDVGKVMRGIEGLKV
ncbi:alpha/beta-hydrolase [Cadophora sp. DSE1049]|nr:alpha/beta-hydrolase [Cadophora sp. DSE1049]